MKKILLTFALLLPLTAVAETAYLAGGCFWGMEELFRAQAGVTNVENGYTGGSAVDPSYGIVSSGTSGHAESIKVDFDPKKTSYENLIVFFFKVHDPTTKNKQGNDVGTQYRSAIFYNDEKQKETAQKVLVRLEKSNAWKKPIVTEIAPFKAWYKAEPKHQDYLQKNPGGYTCHFVRDLKF